jgi:MFS family permease
MAMREVFFGWRVVGTAFVVAVFAWGISFYGPPIFLQHLHATRGWPISLISAAITSHYLLGAIVVANLAALYRRFGTVRITRAGALLTAAGLLGWVYAREPWQLFLATPVSGAGWAMTGGAALNAMVSPWFVRRRPAALSMAFNGASMGGVVFSPLWVALIGWLGLPAAATLVAAAVVGVLWFLAGRYLGSNPAAMGLAVDGDAAPSVHSDRVPGEPAPPLSQPWRDRRFVTLAGASTLGLFAQIGLLAHLFSLLVPIFGEAGAGVTMGTVTACAIGGRSLLGLTMPPGADRRVIAGANFTVQAVGSLVLVGAFMAGAPPVLPVLLGCLLFGLGIGNVTSLPALIAQTEFRVMDLARAVSLVTATGQAGYAFAPVVFGLLRESEGAAPLLFAAAAMFQLAAAVTMLLGRRTAVRKAVRV